MVPIIVSFVPCGQIATHVVRKNLVEYVGPIRVNEHLDIPELAASLRQSYQLPADIQLHVIEGDVNVEFPSQDDPDKKSWTPPPTEGLPRCSFSQCLNSLMAAQAKAADTGSLNFKLGHSTIDADGQNVEIEVCMQGQIHNLAIHIRAATI